MNNVKVIRVKESFDWIEIIEDNDNGRYLERNTITETQLQHIKEKWIELGLDHKSILWGDKKFKFINYVGYVQVEDVAIEILPKVSPQNDYQQMRNALIEMINICYELDILVDYTSNELEQGDLKEILAKYFANTLLKELHRGISQEYRLIEENATSLKGQLQVAQHIRNNVLNNKPYQVAVSYEERVDNHILNQVLKRATSSLIKTVRSFETKKQLRQIDYLLDTVENRSFTKHQLNEIRLNRTNKRFEKPFKLAKQFLLNETNTMQYHDFTNTFVVMFKMNYLFEAYIAILLEEILDRPVYAQDQRHRLFKNEKTNRDIFQLKPDVVIGDENQIIIDTKWKRIFDKEEVTRSGVKREDMFQMYAYLTRYKYARRGVLLYPKTEQPKGEDLFLQSWKLEDQGSLLRVYSVSLVDRETTECELLQILSDISS
ncbi:McrC family protein [Lysinibacillus fusiformis]|uniref:McrC family protein n=1 Tax=Lysinibacillus fusiformis TaxID=28031 RepID=UPI0034E280F8